MKKKRRNTTGPPKLSGVVIRDIKSFGALVASSLGQRLGMRRLVHRQYVTGRGQTLRIASDRPAYRDEDGLYPVLVLRDPKTAEGAYLEIALDYGYDAGTCCLTHASLKVYTGVTPGESALRFRAEWDPRTEANQHAQPHWNIDQVGSIGNQGTSGGDAPWVQPPRLAPWVAIPEAAGAKADELADLSKFHFAMGSNWHLVAHSKDRGHSATLDDEDGLVRWVSGCASYIQAQLKPT